MDGAERGGWEDLLRWRQTHNIWQLQLVVGSIFAGSVFVLSFLHPSFLRQHYRPCPALALAAMTLMFQSCSPSHFRDERHWRVEFSTEAYNLLNALEQIGYKVITSSSFVTGHKKFDTKVLSVPIQGVPINWWCCRTTSGPCTDPPSVTLRCEAA